MDLLLDAVAAAGSDAGVPDLLASAGSVAVVKVVSWAYRDLAERVAARIGARPSHLADTTVGGHWPALLLDRAAAAIAAGRSHIALIAGAEAQASATELRRAGVDPADMKDEPVDVAPRRGTSHPVCGVRHPPTGCDVHVSATATS